MGKTAPFTRYVESLVAGRELNELVATKVMGLKVVKDAVSNGESLWPLPAYSTEIAAAWDVVEKVGEGWCIQFHHADAPETWEVLAERPGNEYESLAFGPTAPLAICRAALWVMGLRE